MDYKFTLSKTFSYKGSKPTSRKQAIWARETSIKSAVPRLKTFENIWKRLKTFENLQKSRVKRLKIFENFWKFLNFLQTLARIVRNEQFAVLSFEFWVFSCRQWVYARYSMFVALCAYRVLWIVDVGCRENEKCKVKSEKLQIKIQQELRGMKVASCSMGR